MSSGRRPASGEDNILARLERDARRGRPGMRWKQSWIAWCSVASLAIIGLIGVLASLARENVELHAPTAVAESRALPDRDMSVASVNAGFAPLPTVAAAPKQPAKVVDTRSERPLAARTALVMLKPEAAPVKPAPAKTVAAIAARKTAPVRAAKAPPPRPVVAIAARPRKTAPVAAAPEPAVDSDVALLSAIIMHASRHAGERAQLDAARCGAGKKCAAAPDPLTSMKATD